MPDRTSRRLSLLGRLELRWAMYLHDLVRRAWWPVVSRRFDHELHRRWREAADADANPLLRAGAKYFSQFDEDGILLEILRRLGLSRAGRFVEIGVGDGTENNTLILLALGWSGVWLGAEPLAWTPSGKRLTFRQAFVTTDNLDTMLGDVGCDVFSLDVDGNDYWIARRALERLAPRVIVVEYNAKFPPPIRFVMPYAPDHRWDGSDWFGVSLASWVDLLSESGYALVCCSYCGLNAFFVQQSDIHRFADVPADPATLFRPALYVNPFAPGHPSSPKTIELLERR